MSIRICSAYRTVPADAVCVQVEVPLIVFLYCIQNRAERYRGVGAAIAGADLKRCQTKWVDSKKRRWTYGIIEV